MRKLIPILLCFALTGLYSAQLDIRYEPNTPSALIMEVKQVLEDAMLVRLPEEGILYANLKADTQQTGYVLSLSYGQAELTLDLKGNPKEIGKRLFIALDHEGLRLLPSIPEPALSVSYPRGYAAKSETLQAKQGDAFFVLDAQQRRQGSVVVAKTNPALGLFIFEQTWGKPLFQGMQLVHKGNLSISLTTAVDVNLSTTVQLLVDFPLNSYPFSFHAGFESVLPDHYGGTVGLSSSVPLSQLFGNGSVLSRNISIGATALLSVGYDFDSLNLYYHASGQFDVSYHFENWAATLSLGNHVLATTQVLTEQGLFLKLGTSYTYTP